MEIWDRALVGGILEVGLCEAGETFVYDAHPEASAAMSQELGVNVVDSNAAVVESADVILLCVKPQVFDEMLSELGDSADRLLISIAAGVQIATIESGVENRHRVIRVMPNTPALIGRGAIWVCAREQRYRGRRQTYRIFALRRRIRLSSKRSRP